MSIACQSREVVAGPTVGFQVGGQGDGSGYIRQQQQQHQQGDAVIRGLSCISIYVHSNSEAKPPLLQTDAPSLRALGVHEMFRPKGHDISEACQAGSATAPEGLIPTKNGEPACKSGDELECLPANPVEQFACLATVGEEERPSGGVFCREDYQDRPKDSMVACPSNSDDDSLSISTEDDDEASGDMEVEGKLKGPLDSMAELEDSLPIKRGLSNFFSGKSRSFTCLADVVSVKDLAKPESPYNKRKRALFGCGNNWERNRFYPPRNSTAGISKKPMHSSKSTLALAVAMSKSDDSLETDERDLHLPPLPPPGKWQRSFASPRSFSLTDLQGV